MSTSSETKQIVSNPYKIKIERNLAFSALIEVINKIISMQSFARDTIPNYDTITEIPEGYLPNDLNTSKIEDWSYGFSASFVYESDGYSGGGGSN